jgi:hypothetical protein
MERCTRQADEGTHKGSQQSECAQRLRIAAQGCEGRNQGACDESRAKTRQIGDGGARTAASAAPCNSLGRECGYCQHEHEHQSRHCITNDVHNTYLTVAISAIDPDSLARNVADGRNGASSHRILMSRNYVSKPQRVVTKDWKRCIRAC